MKAHIKTDKSSAETVIVSREEYDALRAQNIELNQQVQWLMEQVRLARKKAYGTSSEKINTEFAEQLDFLFDESEVHADAKLPEPEIEQVVAHSRQKRSKNAKDRLPEDVPVTVVEHGLSEEQRICSLCGEVMQQIGKEVCRTLVIVPAQVSIREDVYYTYACANCQKTGIQTPILKTPKDKSVISGSFASAEAIAHLMTQKYVMGSPLYRQANEFKRAGVQLTRQTMSNWLLKASGLWLDPIYEELHNELKRREVLHADETPLQVLHEPGRKPTSKSYMWLYRTSGDTNKPIVLYDYQMTRATSHPREFLDGFKGYLHTDGYQVYDRLSTEITVVGCMAHCRRKFEDAVKDLPKSERLSSPSVKGLWYCKRLFAIEDALADCTPEERYKQRQEQAKPILDAFLAWVNSVPALPKSSLGKAIIYTKNQWPHLLHYLDDGRLELSNNRAERSIKPFVMGRKNFLFANTPLGAKGSATMYSMIETAKENGLDPYRYLVYLFRTAPNCTWPETGIPTQLLPWNAPEECRCGEVKGNAQNEH